MRFVRSCSLLTTLWPVVCLAQETTVLDAKRAMSAAKKALEKHVVFHPQDRGGGAFLKSEYARLFQEQQLEHKAERLGDSKENAAKYDIANRLETLKGKYKDEAYLAFAEYVAFVKTYRQYETLIKQDAPFLEKVEQIVRETDALIDRHAPEMTLDSLKWLFAEDCTGKVGAFKLPASVRTVTIKGETIEVIELRTLRDRPILLNKKSAKPREGYTLAEILGKETYETDEGEKLAGYLLQAY